MPSTAENELSIICNQIAWLQRYAYELDYLSQKPTPELSGDIEKIISATAPQFFKMAEMLLVNEIYLGIAKLLDPERQGNNINLTLKKVIKSFTAENSSQRVSAVNKLNKVKHDFSTGSFVRNKLLAHIDYNTALNYESIIDSNHDSTENLQLIIYNICSIVEEISPNANTLPKILPKNDDKWLGIKAVIDRLRQTVTS